MKRKSLYVYVFPIRIYVKLYSVTTVILDERSAPQSQLCVKEIL